VNGCRVVKGGDAARTAQGLSYQRGISAESVGARGICMHLGTVPPGAAAAPHKHDGHETAIYVLSGRAGMDYGPRLEHRLDAEVGDFVYIAAGVPHRPFNLSETEPVVYLVARTDPHEEESVVLLPELVTEHRATWF
jgi:uncharacterized RmlC-like cupin family protein